MLLSVFSSFYIFSDAENLNTKIHESRDYLDISTRYSRVFSTIGAIIVEYKFAEVLAHYHNTSNAKFSLDQEYWSLPSIHHRSAMRLLELCQKNGGVFIKLGQHISTLDYLVPSEYCQVLKCLQSRAFQTPIDQVHRVICQALNISSIDAVFSSFDEIPVGVASLAQVHRAVLKDSSQVVAVKVQHPLVEKFAPLDIQAVGMFARVLKNLFPSFTLQWLAEEISENLPKEIDFLHEATNALRTREIVDELNLEEQSSLYNFLFGSSNQITLCVPKPLLEFCSKKLLVMEFVDDFGCSIEDSSIRTQVMDAINRCFTNLIFRYGWVHCDPHLGNFKLVRPASCGEKYQLAILDHGLYKELSDDIRKSYAKLWLSLIEGDEQGLIESLHTLCPARSSTSRYSEQLEPLTRDGQKAHRLLSSVLSRRSWKALEFGFNVSSSPSSCVKNISITPLITPERLGLITFIFESIQRDLLLVLKTNDLLVSLNFTLSDPEKHDPLMRYIAAVGLACAHALKPNFDDLKTSFTPIFFFSYVQRNLFYYFRLLKYHVVKYIFRL
ncbi:hypothetical protein MDAP_000187 [Mitosporidium daphniae]|uniref:ABC1 atypical kinase-like domain-containing protein n=1 Tax=Mitosporidium daphniae TaxID=1485682 RepID=A0A098VNQ4_9MICR|nr:uncharacterized protein DI09_59p20 [Mitosporidium daphniae]KGG50712.1 hypothetical protein DI09_59p20 [Mitosporidium daphniae]|eukprot:XP_013237155.1 uncharacterized protein DI09_59p20 [Mitosporidium daphniae]